MASSKERLKLLNRAEHAPRLRDTITENTPDGSVLKFDQNTSKWYPGTDSTCDCDAQYVVMADSQALPNDRVLTSGNGVQFTDGGAGESVTAAIYMTGQATGDLLLRGPSDWVRIPQGTEGQLFSVTGSGVSWEDQSYGFPKHISEGAIACNKDGVVSVCSFRFDPATYPGIASFRFQVVLSCMRQTIQSTATARARLYSPVGGIYLSNGSLSTSNTTPTTLTSAAIPVINSGNDGFGAAGGVYELHLDVTNPEAASLDTAILGYAGIIR